MDTILKRSRQIGPRPDIALSVTVAIAVDELMDRTRL
jgi:hypothetical protein